MKNLVIVNATIAVSCSNELSDKINTDTVSVVLNNCFRNNSRYILDARVVDHEVLDGSVNIFKLLDSRDVKVEAKFEYANPDSKNYEIELL